MFRFKINENFYLKRIVFWSKEGNNAKNTSVHKNDKFYFTNQSYYTKLHSLKKKSLTVYHNSQIKVIFNLLIRKRIRTYHIKITVIFARHFSNWTNNYYYYKIGFDILEKLFIMTITSIFIENIADLCGKNVYNIFLSQCKLWYDLKSRIYYQILRLVI